VRNHGRNKDPNKSIPIQEIGKGPMYLCSCVLRTHAPASAFSRIQCRSLERVGFHRNAYVEKGTRYLVSLCTDPKEARTCQTKGCDTRVLVASHTDWHLHESPSGMMQKSCVGNHCRPQTSSICSWWQTDPEPSEFITSNRKLKQ
jgi:hypothetical protein